MFMKKQKSIFDFVGSKSIEKHASSYAALCQIDPRALLQVTKAHIAAHDGKRPPHKKMRSLESRWYKSLSSAPDYSVYGDPFYFADLWTCWIRYSRRYLSDIQKPRSLINKSIVSDLRKTTRVIVDLGCGMGHTTAALKQIFPKAEVYGTNIKDTVQYKVAAKLAQQYGFHMRKKAKPLKADLLFASEYFEHFQNPISQLEREIRTYRPKALLIANAFGTRAIGHFEVYDCSSAQDYGGGKRVSGKDVRKTFRKTLLALGYAKQKTNLWNDRPQYWKLATKSLRG